jgi:hypothetical protein
LKFHFFIMSAMAHRRVEPWHGYWLVRRIELSVAWSHATSPSHSVALEFGPDGKIRPKILSRRLSRIIWPAIKPLERTYNFDHERFGLSDGSRSKSYPPLLRGIFVGGSEAMALANLKCCRFVRKGKRSSRGDAEKPSGEPGSLAEKLASEHQPSADFRTQAQKEICDVEKKRSEMSESDLCTMNDFVITIFNANL